MIQILFVCVGNCCRSQMAEGFARTYAADLLQSASAGLAPTVSIDRETIQAMAERNVDLSSQFPKQFDLHLAARYRYVINMSGYDLPPLDGPTILEWEVDDPYGDSPETYRRVRDQVEAGVVEIINAVRCRETLTSALLGQPIASPEARRTRLWQRFTLWR